MIQRRIVGMVGTGNVGVAAAYNIFTQGIASEIILVDKDFRRAEGEAMDLMHGQAFAERVSVSAGTYADLGAAQVIVISAGVGQKPGETRLTLLDRNTEVFREILQQLDHHAPEAILVIATNPVDMLTYVAQNLSRRHYERVIGTGTMLDTGRFRALLGQYYSVDPRSVHAYILGEHGDSEVPIWSSASIGGLPLLEQKVIGKPFDPDKGNTLFEQVRDAAYEIIDRKGYTSTAIGSVIGRLVQAVLEDQKTVLPISVRLSGEYGIENVCLSIPCVVGLNGVEARVPPKLSREEQEALRRSASLLKKNLKKIPI